MVTRRTFVYQMGAAASLGFTGLHRFAGCREELPPATVGYGPVVADSEGIFNLPEGFSYKVLSRAGERMEDGLIVPGVPDGMAAFQGPAGKTLLVRNHEVSLGGTQGPFGDDNELLTDDILGKVYDRGFGNPCLGGTTTVVVNNATLEVERQFLSLAGTIRNCAGGLTPWGSWITCEESEHRAGDKTELDHGYAFDVLASDDGQLQQARPFTAMGRFNREAVAIDPHNGYVYQTEDKNDGLFYRFIPNDPSDLHAGGRQQALMLLDRQQADMRNWDVMSIPLGERLPVTWIDLEDVEAQETDLRDRGYANGAARFARAEGIWYGDDVIYFACTSGGLIKKGQIWKYYPAREGDEHEGGSLELFIQPDEPSLLENADNLTVAPWGDVFICEDGPGKQNLVGVTPDGQLFRFGENALSSSELAGVTFSPDGSVMFINIQKDGLTLAITGPWENRISPE